MSKQFHSLTVSNIKQETADCVSVSFQLPAELKTTFAYKQGQFLTLRFHLKGKEVRRAYSMSSSPVDDDITVTVKRVQNGLVSTFINDHLKAGQQVEVMPPDGRFFTQLDAANFKTYYLFGAGSGITPLMSILRTILEQEPKSMVHLLYGNRNEDSIIFESALEGLSRRYAGQLTVEHILSQPHKEKEKGLTGLFKKAKMSWQGKVGRIDATQIKQFLAEHPKKGTEAVYYVCGPNNMIEVVKTALKAAGIVDKQMHSEHFNINLSPEKIVSADGLDGARLTAHLDGEKVETIVPEGKTVLDVLLDLKYEPPYSCTSGSCSTCMAKIIKGTVTMDACYALDDDEVADGYILTCQAHPTSDELEVTYNI